MSFSSELPIVLTATIIPNIAGTAEASTEKRLTEYRQVLQFCKQFGPVILLENSDYPLQRHPEFAESPRLHIRRFKPSTHPERGKGYQEFEMIDSWLTSERQPPERWLKITGRYLVLNLGNILDECAREDACSLVIDQVPRSSMARTYLFFVRNSFYQAHLDGLYQQADDRTGDWIERVIFRKLKCVPGRQLRCFKTQPRIHVDAGSSGKAFPSGRLQWFTKQCLRRLNQLVDRRQLWYSR